MKKTLQTVKNATAKLGLLSAFAALSFEGNAQTTTVVYSGAYTTYTVPAGVSSIKLEARGGQGKSAQLGFLGGQGAKMSGDFTVTPGTVLLIAVGGQGILSSGGSDGGGGGATTIAKIDPLSADIIATGIYSGIKVTPLVIAGGGGGMRTGATVNGNPGVTSNFGTDASGSLSSGGGVIKATGLGIGGIMSSASWGSAGAGFRGNGANDGTYGTGGASFLNGGVGGLGTCSSGSGINGGFGGGGSGGGCNGGGGGGGYSGGDGGWIAGGGGSWNTGANQLNTTGFQAGDGVAIITVLYGLSISQTSTIACNGLLTAALSASVSGGTGPFTYSWSPTGGTASTATGLGAGSYTCTVSSSVSGTTSSVFTVTQPSAVVSTIASQTNVTCYGGTNGVITLTTTGGTAPYSYTWSPSGGSAATASGLAANTYSCIVKDANNCSATSPSTTITQPATFSVATSNSIICTGETASLTATGATSYTWNTASTSSVIAVSPTVTTTYTVTGMTGVCTNSMTITQNVSVCTGINEALANLISVYPNPNNGVLNITLTNELSKNSSLEVYDALGKLVIKQVLANELNTINISNFENGIYLYKVLNNTNIVKVGKLVKQ